MRKSRLDMKISVLQATSKAMGQTKIARKTRLNEAVLKDLLEELETLEMIQSHEADSKKRGEKGKTRILYSRTPKGSKIIVRYRQLMQDLGLKT